MGVVFPEITEKHAAFMKRMPVFFVATAPTSTEHRINVSPRSPGTSVVVTGPTTVHWGDLSGSGCETAAHVFENGRMTLLFVNILDGPPNIVRLHGTAKVLLPEETDQSILDQLPKAITESKGFRCVYRLDVNRITTSCGFTMPIMKVVEERTVLDDFMENKDMEKYREMYNGFSIDGIPSLTHLKDASANLGPHMEKGYLVSRPLKKTDITGKLQAKRRQAQIAASPARRDLGQATKHNQSTFFTSSFTTHTLALVAGVLACLAFQGLKK